MATEPPEMETLQQAIGRLRELGYTQDWYAKDGSLRCGARGATYDPATVTVDHIVRFEGTSDPGDEAILFALTTECSHRGLYSAAYGADMSAADIDVVRALPAIA